jgi:hypothetical protein
MDMDQAAVWLAGSILFSLGFVVLIAAVIVVNNILHKYWKPVRIFTPESWNINPPVRYATPEELENLASTLNEKNVKGTG